VFVFAPSTTFRVIDMLYSYSMKVGTFVYIVEVLGDLAGTKYVFDV